MRGRMAQCLDIFAHGFTQKRVADHTKAVGVRLNGAQALQTRRDVLPSETSVVERGLDIPMDLENDRELMRQGNDGRAPGLTSKAFLPARVHTAAADTAVLGGGLLDGGITSRTSADLERSDLLQTMSDRQRFPSKTFTAAAATPSLSPNALLNYARPLSCVKHWRSLSTPRHHQED